jgi:transcriptional regulator GlxA family with amidase domain
MIEGSLAQVSDLAALAKAAHVSERTLSRRFAAATGHSVRGYVAECRLELARLMLRGTTDPLTLIADECGFGSVSALVRAFGTRHGISPMRYRQRAA